MSREKEDLKNLLTAREVAKTLRIPLSTIYRLSKEGKIRAIKIGKHWRYSKADIENYLASGTDSSDPPPRSTSKIEEQREYPRINCHFPCKYRVSIAPIKEIESNGIVRNISGGGVLLEVEDANITNIKIDDPIELQFEFTNEDGQNVFVNSSGRVVRRTYQGFGVKFRHIKNNAKDEIIRHVG